MRNADVVRRCAVVLTVVCVLTSVAARCEGTLEPAVKTPLDSSSDEGGVFWVVIDDGPDALGGMVDTWLTYHVRTNIQRARDLGASKIVFAITTYGGLVIAADKIVNEIMMAEPLETIAYVDDRAISAGALIALSCDRVFMKEKSMMGDAMAITQGQSGETKAVGEKITTFMRTVFRLTAEKRVALRGGYAENFIALAEAMTDPEVEVVRVEVDGEQVFVRETELNEFSRQREKEGKKVDVFDPIIRAGKILTMTSKEGLEKYRLIDGVVKNRDGLLAALDANAFVIDAPPISWGEELARFMSGPIISGLLVMLISVGIFMEIMSPGKGIGAFIFLFALGGFFWSQFLAGHAGSYEAVFFVIGIVLLAVEVFAIPGFGVFGIAGVVFIVVSLVMALIPSQTSAPGLPDFPFPWDELRTALASVLGGMAVGSLVLMGLARYLPRAPLFNKLMLQTPDGVAVEAGGGMAVADPLVRLVGKRGAVHTDLRPAGKVDIDGEIVDAVSDAEFIAKGEAVEVMEASGNRVVVRPSSGAGAQGATS